MDIDMMLCDHAEAAENKLFINGAAINLLFVEPQPPHVVNFAVAVVIQVPYNETNVTHQLTISLVNEDGEPVVPWTPDGSLAVQGPVEITGDFNVGRPPGLPPGETQAVPFAFQLQLPMPGLGSYSVIAQINGVEARRLPFRVLTRT